MLTPDAVREELKRVMDPEVMLDIVNMGLVYDVAVRGDGDVTVTMTLTTPFCPAGDQIVENVKRVAGGMEGAGEVEVDIVWEPRWSPAMFSPELKQEFADMGVDIDGSLIPEHGPGGDEAAAPAAPVPTKKRRGGFLGWLLGS